jgi:DNA-binding response OmpR family regulator
MDIMMPNMDGYTCVKGIREICDTPVIMLSARVDEVDKLKGFDLGIDDYVTKPFSPKELMARIKAHTKRTVGGEVLTVGNIVLDNKSHTVTIDGEEVEVTSTQFDLLSLFLNNQGVALSREKIIECIFGYEYEADDRTIDAHIKLLRKKLGKYSESIKTVRKIGYKFIYETT